VEEDDCRVEGAEWKKKAMSVFMPMSVSPHLRSAPAFEAMRPTVLVKTEQNAARRHCTLVLVRLSWRTHESEVFLSLPMRLEEEKGKEFAVHGDRSPHIANTCIMHY
jgi:hypothetical protein